VRFQIVITKTSDMLSLSVVTADKGYDTEDKHAMAITDLNMSQCGSQFNRL
jgi:hypothetical protein